jgi:CubicO group peptidase (beta-lactamase class C family)
LIHDEIGEVLKRWVVFSGAAPGASAFVAAFHEGQWLTASGVAGALSSQDATPVTPETIYDLASLTKPAVACAAARLCRQRALDWATPLGVVLRAAQGTASENTALEFLAAHRAGLEAHLTLTDRVDGVPGNVRGWMMRCANARRAECSGGVPDAGFAPVYSDLGYILLGGALESVVSLGLEPLVQREVCVPLSLELGSAAHWAAQLGSQRFRQRVAPSEVVPERGGELRGVVHDDNAWAIAGCGLAGHAGLFGTAASVGLFGMAVLDALGGRRAGWLTASEARFLVRPRPGGSLRAGFDGKADSGSSAGPRFGADAFGHLGFTGTSLWCDPDAEVLVALLTNRVFPTRDNIRLRSVRPNVHGELFGLAADLRVGPEVRQKHPG